MNFSDGTCDFSSDKIVASSRAFVVEKNSITSEHSIGLSVVFHDVEAVEFSAGIKKLKNVICQKNFLGF